jgi:hypothetical protein
MHLVFAVTCVVPAAAAAAAGAGAVHKSPGVAGDSEARLLLTVDDACCSS